MKKYLLIPALLLSLNASAAEDSGSKELPPRPGCTYQSAFGGSTDVAAGDNHSIPNASGRAALKLNNSQFFRPKHLAF